MATRATIIAAIGFGVTCLALHPQWCYRFEGNLTSPCESWWDTPGRIILVNQQCRPTGGVVCTTPLAATCPGKFLGCAGSVCPYFCAGVSLYVCQPRLTYTCDSQPSKPCYFGVAPLCEGVGWCACSTTVTTSWSCGAPYAGCNT